MYAHKVYTPTETAGDQHDASGEIFFRKESGGKVYWQIARFGSESDKEAVRQIWNCAYVRVTTADGHEYHRICMSTVPSVMSCSIARHMGMEKKTVEAIIRNLI